jgi:hypothetical protein
MKRRMVTASAADLPRISFTTRRTFRGDILNHFVFALLCMAFFPFTGGSRQFYPGASRRL